MVTFGVLCLWAGFGPHAAYSRINDGYGYWAQNHLVWFASPDEEIKNMPPRRALCDMMLYSSVNKDGPVDDSTTITVPKGSVVEKCAESVQVKNGERWIKVLYYPQPNIRLEGWVKNLWLEKIDQVEYFSYIENLKPQLTSSTTATLLNEITYDYRQGEIEIGPFAPGTVLTPTALGALVWDPTTTDGSGGINGASRTPRTCTNPQEFPAPDLAWGSLLVNGHSFNKPFTVSDSNTVKIDCNDRFGRRGDNQGNIQISVSTGSS